MPWTLPPTHQHARASLTFDETLRRRAGAIGDGAVGAPRREERHHGGGSHGVGGSGRSYAAHRERQILPALFRVGDGRRRDGAPYRAPNTRQLKRRTSLEAARPPYSSPAFNPCKSSGTKRPFFRSSSPSNQISPPP